jgi:hypothetical protein
MNVFRSAPLRPFAVASALQVFILSCCGVRAHPITHK